MFMLEFPGVVIHIDKANRMLGGVTAITEAADGKRELALNPRPDNIYAHPIMGRVVPFSGLLCRRERKQDPTGKSTASFVIVDTVLKVGRFRHLADFQLNYDLTARIPQLCRDLDAFNVDALQEFRFDQGAVTEMPCSPAYTQIAVPLDYQFRQLSSVIKVQLEGQTDDAEPTYKLVNRSRQNRVRFQCIQVRFDAIPPVPTGIQPESAPPVAADLKERVRSLFERRPIWTRQALETELPDFSSSFIRNALVLYAFQFLNGPWRSCWVRFGYDPKANAESRMYQLLDIRSQRMQRRAREAQWQRETRPLTTFTETFQTSKARPLRSQLACWYQLCDIHHPFMRKIIDLSGSLRDSCDERDGWFRHAHFDAIRRTMKYFLLTLWTDKNLPEEGVARLPFTQEELDVLEEHLLNYIQQGCVAEQKEDESVDKKLQEFMKQLSHVTDMDAKDDMEYDLLEEEEEEEDGDDDDEDEDGDKGKDLF